MEPFHHAAHVGKDRILAFDKRIRRQAAFAFAQAHGAAGGMETQPHRGSGLDRIVQA